jgi:proline dehydrogenase
MRASNFAIQFLMQRAGSAYVTGPAVEHVRAVCEGLGAERIASTVCYWNGPLDSPPAVCDNYIRLLDVIREMPCDCYLSIKAPALGFDLGLLQEILYRAKHTNTTVHFDSLSPDTVDRTFALIDAARAIYRNIGCTLPARWGRSAHDVDYVIDMDLRVRLVKGQWAGPNGDETNPREGFVRLVDVLSAKGARHVAVATHNPAAAACTLPPLKTAGIPCELELLNGLPFGRMLKLAREHNIATRVYVPCGHAALPYRLREVRRDPRILFWFARDLIRS